MKTRFAPALAATVLLAAFGSATAKDDDDRTTCESKDGHRHTCRIDTRGGVRLVEQTSRTRCVQGRNWGWSDGRVWVDDNCSGRFESRGDRRDDHRNQGDGLRGQRAQSDACADAVAREPGIRRDQVRVVRVVPVSGQDGGGRMNVQVSTPRGRYLCTMGTDGRVENVSR